MLVLSRRMGEAVLLGENIVVRVLKVRGSRVSIGIDAPSEVAIRRDQAECTTPSSAEDSPQVTSMPSVATPLPNSDPAALQPAAGPVVNAHVALK